MCNDPAEGRPCGITPGEGRPRKCACVGATHAHWSSAAASTINERSKPFKGCRRKTRRYSQVISTFSARDMLRPVARSKPPKTKAVDVP